ncbi:MAG: chromosome segregation protein SMC [Coraliomargaritaceae bacterium]
MQHFTVLQFMYLKEIVISGFKSFADRTRLDLRHGITAVVGPNGCGKSNIVDAIRWVLGEQSAKALRGGSMQDVIFEGTDKRKALPYCEVALTFTDCEEELGTAFNEVSVSRRVSREGGSDYYINGKVSRLKDIQRLFANTGVGRVSYSFMLQGQIDQILSTNPAERRTIFEEAAGITLYKAQRKEALNKLALVDANLARVTDVIEEVGRQIGSLKRQASKALRYQRIHHRLTHLDLANSAYRYSGYQKSLTEQSESAEKSRSELEARTESLASDEASLAELRTTRAERFEKMQDLQQRIYNLRSEMENATNQAEFAEIRTKDTEQRITECGREIKELEARKAELSNRAAGEAQSKQLQLGVVDDSDRIFKEQSDQLLRLQEVLQELEARLQGRRQDTLLAENRISRARSNCTTLEVELKTYQVKHASLTESEFSLGEEAKVLESEQARIQHARLKREEEKQSAESAVESAREESKKLLARFRSLQEQIQEKDRGIAQQSAQLNILEGLQAKFEGFGEGAKAILGNKLEDLVSGSGIAVLSKELKIPPAYTKAVEALLGPAAEALYIGKSDQALSILGKLDADKLGRACLQIDLSISGFPLPADLPPTIVPAGSAVQTRNPALAEPLENLLAGCYLAESLEDFVAYWNEHPGFSFLFAATARGEIIDCRGLVHGGADSGEQASSVLERESEIRLLRVSIEEGRKALNQQREEATALDENCHTAEAALESGRRRFSELSSEVAALIAEERGISVKIEEKGQARHRISESLAELEGSHNDSVEALETARTELAAAEQGLVDERRSGSDLEQAIENARQARDAKREALSDVRLELAEKKQRLESLDRALSEAERESSGLQERILQRNQEIDSLNEQTRKLREGADEQVARSRELERTLGVATDEIEKDRQAVLEMDNRISGIDGVLAKRRIDTRELEQSLTKLEVHLAEERSQSRFIESTVQDSYQLEISEIDWRAEFWRASIEFEKRVKLDELDDPDKIIAQPKENAGEPTEEDLESLEAPDWSSVGEEVKELKSRIASMGPVNLDAIGEYADLKERHDFLKGQSEDLWNSKNALIKTIDEINETSQTLFRDTFEQVRKNFAFTYSKLSGGGESDLKLIDSEDPLESGIEIIARPPGTRLKSVTLLSGGQRTMAAVALLFAIYIVKPSPFCVLDEIDAALDDANIGRFCETLHGFTDKSQFLIITHNKRTISNADTVFGVTMPEKGVSTLISMRFNKETNAPEMAGS